MMNSYKTTAKPHATVDKKIVIPLYAEHLHLLISRRGWRVTKIRGHYTFEQNKFKKRICNYESGFQAKSSN